MSLLNTFNADNRVVHQALAKRYVLTGKATDTLYEVHRYTTKTWSYVGMDYVTAIRCRDSKSDLLKRSFFLWTVNGNNATNKTVTMMVDGVEAVHEEGGMWRVDIQVNEDDVYYTTNPGNDLSLLSWPITGSYDE